MTVVAIVALDKLVLKHFFFVEIRFLAFKL